MVQVRKWWWWEEEEEESSIVVKSPSIANTSITFPHPPPTTTTTTTTTTTPRFGMVALQEFKSRLHEWPQYCSHIVQIPHLRQNHPELVAEIEREMASSSGGNTPALPGGGGGIGSNLLGGVEQQGQQGFLSGGARPGLPPPPQRSSSSGSTGGTPGLFSDPTKGVVGGSPLHQYQQAPNDPSILLGGLGQSQGEIASSPLMRSPGKKE